MQLRSSNVESVDTVYEIWIGRELFECVNWSFLFVPLQILFQAVKIGIFRKIWL